MEKKPTPLITHMGCVLRNGDREPVYMDMTNWRNETDDEIAWRAIDFLTPGIIATDPTRCIMYHDPALNTADEIMLLNADGEWIVVDWLSCEMVGGIRKTIYRGFATVIRADEALTKRIWAIRDDWTRVRRDLDRMFPSVKMNSPKIIALRNDPAGDIVGSKSAAMDGKK